MALYLDIHRNIPGANRETVEKAHLADLAAQSRHGVHYLKYWYDESKGTVCCLVDAPSADACQAVHREAHGGVADQIIEVEGELLGAFLGQGALDRFGGVVAADGRPLGAFRTVVFTDIVGSTALTQSRGDEAGLRAVRTHDRVVRHALDDTGGTEVKHTGDGIMAAFLSAAAAAGFAVQVQRDLAEHASSEPDEGVVVRVGMSAGEPIDENHDLFGATVQLAARVCAEAGPGEILVANVVRELCRGKNLTFEDRGERSLKGFPEPVRVHALLWR